MLTRTSQYLFLAGVFLAGCSAAPQDGDTAVVEGEFSSPNSTLVDFDFDGALETDSVFGNGKTEIQDQMLYTIGHLNTDRSVGRLDKLTLTNVKTLAIAGGRTRVTYHAKLPVAWSSKTSIPATYALTLPRDVSFSGQEAFTTKYKAACVDFSAHEVSSGNMWYYYRPHTGGCTIAPADVLTFTATVRRSTENTSGRFPEYQKVWEDNQLNMVAIFGKYEDGQTSASDAGIDGYNQFIRAMQGEFRGQSVVTTPAVLPAELGASAPDVSFAVSLAGGKKVNVTALLVDNISQTTAAFDARYESLSARADIIAYNGHAGLGQNVRALGRKGKFVPKQYVIVFMNGCDTFSYVDGSLAQTRAALNPDDPTGTKYMEFVTNAMPAFFSSMPTASLSLLRGLEKTTAPQTYDQIFSGVDRSQMVLVTGEEDNVFRPGMPIGH